MNEQPNNQSIGGAIPHHNNNGKAMNIQLTKNEYVNTYDKKCEILLNGQSIGTLETHSALQSGDKHRVREYTVWFDKRYDRRTERTGRCFSVNGVWYYNFSSVWDADTDNEEHYYETRQQAKLAAMEFIKEFVALNCFI